MNLSHAQPARLLCGCPPRLFAYVVMVILAAVPIVAAAVAGVLTSLPGAATLLGISVFLGLAILAELKPVPLDEAGSRLVSLTFVFIVSGQIVFGWEIGVLIGVVSLAIAQVAARTPRLKAAFNTAVYAVAAFAASLPWFALAGHGDPFAERRLGFLTAVSFLEGAIFVGLNVALVCVAIALFERVPARGVFANHIRHSGPAFSIMAFIAALTVALWAVWPPLLVLLAGPVFALALFQRYALRTKVALLAASTDSLTALKNHRSYEADLAGARERAIETGSGFALCLLDIDDFKRINDLHGHPVGDRLLVVLSEEMARLGHGIESYRLGGDEFALIVEAGEESALVAVETLRDRVAASDLPHAVTFSAGISCYPECAEDVQELRRVADVALYQVKRGGKNRSRVYSPNLLELSWSDELAATVEYDARLRAVGNLIRVVDARDTYTGSHSQSVAVLVEGIGRTLGLSDAGVSQLRLAGLLHDLGKIAVPDAILRKPSRLDPEERTSLRRHPVIAFELLQGLDVDPVDLWILHHHEHWDGSGYPHGLSGDQIPIGSRAILVADAFDAMTTERCYRNAMSVDDALAELRHRSGTQFDPAVVGGLERWLSRLEVAAA